MASRPLAILQCMVCRSQVLVNPFLTTIMIHASLCVFDKLMFVNLLYVDVSECNIDDQFFVLLFLLIKLFLSYGTQKYVIIIVITYVLNKE
jgi:hypothetical protein